MSKRPWTEREWWNLYVFMLAYSPQLTNETLAKLAGEIAEELRCRESGAKAT
jgi:hypothetical protein